MNTFTTIKRIEINGIFILLDEKTPETIAAHEKWRIENNFYLSPPTISAEPLMLDIGAAFGIWAIYMALLYPGAEIRAIEPNPERYEILLNNIEFNQCKNIIPFHGWPVCEEVETTLLFFSNSFSVSGSRECVEGFSKAASGIPGVPERLFLDHYDILRVVVPMANVDILKKLPRHCCDFIIGEAWQNEASPIFFKRELSRVATGGGFSISGFEKGIPCIHANTKTFDYDISVVVPVYNVEKFLPQCVDSLLRQKNVSLEILLINDGSTDSSGKIADEYQKKYPFIRHISQPNAGCAAARQNGLQLAKGKYIAFVDSDDWLSGDALTRAFELACLDDPDIVQFGYVKVFDATKEKEFYDGHDLTNYENKLLTKKEIENFLFGSPSIWRRIYKRDFLTREKLVFATQFRRYDDLPFQFETISTAKTMRVLPETHYFYRLDRPEQDVAISDDRLFIHFDLLHHVFSFIQERGLLDLSTDAMIIYLNTHKWALGKIDENLRDEYLRRLREDTEVKTFFLQHKETILRNLSKEQKHFFQKKLFW
ncbi:MAG: FkbM family methyltransferase [Puniceicoccales bacterium]|jgi:glycosyltransferase involved in cell wall biosynthesis|nr:FkbM family methyltransferase [Puniceicoccales bacterium]